MRQEHIERALRRPSLEAEWRHLVASSEVEACSMAAALGAVRQAREGLLRQAAMVLADEERPVTVLVQYLALRGLAEDKRRAMAQLLACARAGEAAQLALELALESRLMQALEELLAPMLGLLRHSLNARVLSLAGQDWRFLPGPVRSAQPA